MDVTDKSTGNRFVQKKKPVIGGSATAVSLVASLGNHWPAFSISSIATVLPACTLSDIHPDRDASRFSHTGHVSGRCIWQEHISAVAA